MYEIRTAKNDVGKFSKSWTVESIHGCAGHLNPFGKLKYNRLNSLQCERLDRKIFQIKILDYQPVRVCGRFQYVRSPPASDNWKKCANALKVAGTATYFDQHLWHVSTHANGSTTKSFTGQNFGQGDLL